MAFGKLAIPHLEHFLLDCPPRTISIPRCRAAVLSASWALTQFSCNTSCDTSVPLTLPFCLRRMQFAVRRQRTRPIHSEEVYSVLLEATRQRATSGLVQALGAFRRHESVPLLVQLLEDDLCRIDAMAELRKVPNWQPNPTRSSCYADARSTPIQGPIFRGGGIPLFNSWLTCIPESEWPEIRQYLHDEDLDCVIAATRLGLCVVRDVDTERLSSRR